MTEQQSLALIALSVLLSFVGGRASVGGVSHTDECAPEIAAIETAEQQIGVLTGQQAQAEARGLERCVAREREACEERIRATEEAGAALDCLICRKRCPDGSVP
tara:strand:- start:210 stop:521 length:312 start_codon:yes stop_codon:yes gene_type:complete